MMQRNQSGHTACVLVVYITARITFIFTIYTITQLSRTRFLRVVVTKFFLTSQLHWRTQTLTQGGGGGKGVFCRLPCRLFFLLRFFFLTQNIEEGEGGGPGPSPRSAAEFSKHRGKRRFAANDTLSCQVKAFSIQGKNLQLLVSWHQHQIPQRGYWDSNNLFFLGFPLDNQKSHEEKYNLANSHHVVIILHGPAKVEITLFQHSHQESTKKNQFELTLQQN